jgi:hypothetical protein
MAVKKITHTSTLPLDIMEKGRDGLVEYGTRGGDSYALSKSEYRQLGKPDKIRLTQTVEAVK